MDPPKHLQGKSITTSVPSIAVRFHTGDEELELYPSAEDEEDEGEKEGCNSTGATPPTTSPSVTPSIPSRDPSPMKEYLKGIGKRSTSVDGGIMDVGTSSSDTWRIFHELKGKITKTVEEKLTEMKSDRKSSNTSTPILSGLSSNRRRLRAGGNDNNSSISDSEDISEKSTKGETNPKSPQSPVKLQEDLVSQKEKSVTFSSTDENDEMPSTSIHSATHGKLKKKKKKKHKSGDNSDSTGAATSTLRSRKISSTHVEPNRLNKLGESSEGTDSDGSGVESGVEVLEETQLYQDDDDIYNIPTIDYRDNPPTTHGLDSHHEKRRRHAVARETMSESYLNKMWNLRYVIATVVAATFYTFIPISSYFSGLIAGVFLTMLYNMTIGLANWYSPGDDSEKKPFHIPNYSKKPILEVPDTNDVQLTSTQCAGWMNELPDTIYNSNTYHINNTQSVYVRLEGSTLRLSHPKAKINKRASWNEKKYKMKFVHQRIYNIYGCSLKLLPEGLTRKRTWSKKYPICIVLTKEAQVSDLDLLNEEESEPQQPTREASANTLLETALEEDIVEEMLKETASDSTIGSEFFNDDVTINRMTMDVSDDDTFCLIDRSMLQENHLYMFARCDRQKEDWYRRFSAAVKYKPPVVDEDGTSTQTPPESEKQVEVSIPEFSYDFKDIGMDEFVTSSARPMATDEYLEFMNRFNLQIVRDRASSKICNELKLEREVDCDVMWVNAIIGHILYDVLRNPVWIEKIKEKWQKKLETIKLPYFMETMILKEVELGTNVPLIHRASQAVLDEHGLWVDLDVSYEGNMVLVLETKLNLMKLKKKTVDQVIEQAASEDPAMAATASTEKCKSPIFDSDLEDTAESSETTADETDGRSSSEAEAGGKSSETSPSKKPVVRTSKGVMRMMNKIVASKYFQSATENKFIKRAMEGVSNTVITLNVEIRGLTGEMAVNMPPPPSDRLWFGFRGNPKIWLKARPKFGERHLNIKHVAAWIEKKLIQEFQKKFVIPNMDNVVISPMSTKLPE